MKRIENYRQVKGGYVKLTSDNWSGAILTGQAYREALLQMSTGEFHTHVAYRVGRETAQRRGYITLKALINNAF